MNRRTFFSGLSGFVAAIAGATGIGRLFAGEQSSGGFVVSGLDWRGVPVQGWQEPPPVTIHAFVRKYHMPIPMPGDVPPEAFIKSVSRSCIVNRDGQLLLITEMRYSHGKKWTVCEPLIGHLV